MEIISAMPGALAQGLIWGIMAIGLYITYKILDFADLTVDGSLCTGAAVCAVLIAAGANPWLAILAAFFAGAIAGLITGLLHTLLGIPAILSGILTQLMLWSINLKILGKANLSLNPRVMNLAVSMLETWKTVAVVAAVLAALIAVLYWFFGTEIGSSIRATGSNPEMCRSQGINTELNKVIALMLSNAIVALSGAFLAQYQGFADINMGRGAIVIGLAAVIVGLAVFSKAGKNFAVRLIGVVVGSIIYYVVYQTVIGLGLDKDLLKLFSALVVAVFLAVPHWKNKFASVKKTEKKSEDGNA